MRTRDEGHLLLKLARHAIAEKLGEPHIRIAHRDWMHHPGATFVTLSKHKQLRGCIGSLEAYRPLLEDVRQNACAAAFHDPRFHPLHAQEYQEIEIEVSLLSKPEPIQFADEFQALEQLRPGIDGIIFECGRYRSTFLPQVWEQLPQAEVFMQHLKYKAGLPVNYWSDDVRLSRYTVQKWREVDFDGSAP